MTTRRPRIFSTSCPRQPGGKMKCELNVPISNRVIMTPHAIGHNVETGPTGVQMAFDNIDRALRGELPESVINPEIIPAWQRRMACLHACCCRMCRRYGQQPRDPGRFHGLGTLGRDCATHLRNR